MEMLLGVAYGLGIGLVSFLTVYLAVKCFITLDEVGSTLRHLAIFGLVIKLPLILVLIWGLTRLPTTAMLVGGAIVCLVYSVAFIWLAKKSSGQQPFFDKHG